VLAGARVDDDDEARGGGGGGAEVGMIGIASLVAAKSQAPKEADSGEAKVGEKQRDARKLG
jgi:hypothetical protein